MKYKVPPVLQYSIVVSLAIALLSLKYSPHDVLAGVHRVNDFGNSLLASPGSSNNVPLFDKPRFRPVERFDLSNIKYSWIIFSILVLLVSFILA